MNEWQNFKKPDALELEAMLDPLVFEVTQKEATERPGSSPLDRNDTAGIYVDAVSGEPLFSSRDKYDAGCGWPSFTKPIRERVIVERTDTKLRIHRTEVRSEIADSHLGHVFTDGPSSRGGLRYCINGAALRFVPQADMEAAGYGEFLAQL